MGMKRINPETLDVQAPGIDAGKENLTGSDILAEHKNARSCYTFYEAVYQRLDSKAKAYVRRKSEKYKKTLMEIQREIYPHVKEVCSSCADICCRLQNKERHNYIASYIGYFKLVDYLLARCDTELPEPLYENAEKNLCVFWRERCILPLDCRSYTCIGYFCEDLSQKIDKGSVTKLVESAHKIVTGFSVSECLHLSADSLRPEKNHPDR
jgi:hypothetical protein